LKLSLGEDAAEMEFVFPKKPVTIDDEGADKLAVWKVEKG